MGNQPSSEKSHRTPQKLSKPRVGRHQTTASTSLLSGPIPDSRKSSGLSPRPAATSARHSNSHLISDPLTTSPADARNSDVWPKEEELPARHAPERRKSGLNQDGGRRRSSWFFQSSQSQNATSNNRRNSALMAATDATEGPRTSSPSVMQRGAHQNWNPPNSGFKRRSTHHGTAYFDSTYQRPNEGNTSSSPEPPGDRSSQFYVEQQQRDLFNGLPGQAQPTSTAIFIPTRRRSTIETPGVATRPHPDSAQYLERRRSYRNSLPTVPSPVIPSPATFDTFEEFEAHMKANLCSPEPTAVIGSYSSSRIVTTPAEDDEYKQLGVMKFGSLRITNGHAEVTTPGQEIEDPCSKMIPGYLRDDTTQVQCAENTNNGGDTNENSWRPLREISPKTSDVAIRKDNPCQGETVVVPKPNVDLGKMTSSDLTGEVFQTGQTVKRSDSGVGSTMGSDKSNAHIPHLDSGYSSSVSLRSFFGSKKKRNQEIEDKPSEEQELGEPRPELKEQPQYSSPVHQDVIPAVPKEPDALNLDPLSATPTSRSRSNSTRSGVSIASKKSTDSSSSKRSRFSRLFKSRRQSLPESHSLAIFADSATPMPADAQDKLREHKSKVSTESDERSSSKKAGGREKGASKPSHLARAASILVPKSSNQTVTSKSREPSRKIRVDEEDDVMDSEPIWGYEAQVASVDSIRKSAGNSAFDQAFVQLSDDYGPPVPLKDSKSHGKKSNATHRLRTRKSAPEFLETVRETASPSCLEQKQPKTPPPVSFHTRGSKKKRRSKQHNNSSSLPAEPGPVPPPPPPKGDDYNEADPNSQYLSHSLRSFPLVNPQRRTDRKSAQGFSEPQQNFHQNPHARALFSNPTQQGPHAIPPSDPVRRSRSQTTTDSARRHDLGSQPESPSNRVLHSYNSPTYKGAVIRNH